MARIAATQDGDYDLLGQAIITSSHAYNIAGLYTKALERIAEFEAHRERYSGAAQAEDARALFNRGIYCRNLGQTEAARECMQTAYELASARGLPQANRYRFSLVWLLLSQKDSAAALPLIEAGEGCQCANEEEQHLHNLRQKVDRAYYALQTGAAAEAYDLCVEALNADPPADVRAVILSLLREMSLAMDQLDESLGLAILAAQAASEAGRRDLLAEAQASALALAQRLSPTQLEQILSQLRSVAVA